MQRLTKAVHVTAGNDRFDQPVHFFNGRFDCKVSGKDTGDGMCIYETIRARSDRAPLHYHHDQDEWFFVREGEFLFQVGEDRFRLTAGDSILGPRKIPHAFATLSDIGRLMIIYQPAGTIERFFADGTRLVNPTPADWQALHRANGMEIVGPPLKAD